MSEYRCREVCEDYQELRDYFNKEEDDRFPLDQDYLKNHLNKFCEGCPDSLKRSELQRLIEKNKKR